MTAETVIAVIKLILLLGMTQTVGKNRQLRRISWVHLGLSQFSSGELRSRYGALHQEASNNTACPKQTSVLFRVVWVFQSGN